MSRMINYDGQVYGNMEEYLSALIDRLDAIAMEMAVYQDEWPEDEAEMTVYVIKGYAMAVRLLASDYIKQAPAERVHIVQSHIDQLDDIILA